ncbi:MAG: hypothetical protein D6729_12880 [Deltaproteobacteria bacterium]|nr:MAG: hypothetical protein D6729_12880 [Deltaproteobacteria bacterium]
MGLRLPRFLAFFGGIVAVCGACGAPPKPCTECPDIAGSYQLSAQGIEAGGTGNGCQYVDYRGAETVISLVQSGSSVALTGYYDTQGTLYDNMQIAFDPVTYERSGLGLISLSFGGTVTGQPGAWRIDGAFTFVLTGEESCSVTSPVVATQL